MVFKKVFKKGHAESNNASFSLYSVTFELRGGVYISYLIELGFIPQPKKKSLKALLANKLTDAMKTTLKMVSGRRGV